MGAAGLTDVFQWVARRNILSSRSGRGWASMWIERREGSRVWNEVSSSMLGIWWMLKAHGVDWVDADNKAISGRGFDSVISSYQKSTRSIKSLLAVNDHGQG